MRTFVIADAHGHPEIIRKALDNGGFSPARDRLVFAGDFLDRGSDAQGCLVLVERYATDVLLGNHDLAVLLDVPVWPQDPESPSYRPLLIDKVLHRDTGYAWKAAVAVDGVLVSHAGISARYERVFRGVCRGEPAELADHLNQEFRRAVARWLEMKQGDGGRSTRAEASADSRGIFGDYGPFWFRPPPYTHARPLAGVTQVAGHSPPVPELAKDDFYMIDPAVWLTPPGEPLRFRYAVIEQGQVRVEEGV